MLFMGIPIHQISVIGLVIALGILIDNAIVTVDEIRKHLERGESQLGAIRKSVSHLFAPLLASTLTTVFAFLPIVGVPGNVGDFIRTMGVNVILAVGSSFLISMTIIATLTGIFGYVEPSKRRTDWWSNGGPHSEIGSLGEASGSRVGSATGVRDRAGRLRSLSPASAWRLRLKANSFLLRIATSSMSRSGVRRKHPFATWSAEFERWNA